MEDHSCYVLAPERSYSWALSFLKTFAPRTLLQSLNYEREVWRGERNVFTGPTEQVIRRLEDWSDIEMSLYGFHDDGEPYCAMLHYTPDGLLVLGLSVYESSFEDETCNVDREALAAKIKDVARQLREFAGTEECAEVGSYGPPNSEGEFRAMVGDP